MVRFCHLKFDINYILLVLISSSNIISKQANVNKFILFLNIFTSSPASKAIAKIVFSKTFLIVGIGAFLGVITGRVQVPISILLPIYSTKFGAESMTYFVFAVMFFATFMGYMFSPLHPCLSVSVEYFNTDLKTFYSKALKPVIISLLVVAVISIIFIG